MAEVASEKTEALALSGELAAEDAPNGEAALAARKRGLEEHAEGEEPSQLQTPKGPGRKRRRRKKARAAAKTAATDETSHDEPSPTSSAASSRESQSSEDAMQTLDCSPDKDGTAGGEENEEEAMEMSSPEEMDLSEGEAVTTQTAPPISASESTYTGASAQSNLEASREERVSSADERSSSQDMASSSRGSSPDPSFRRERKSPTYGEYRRFARSSSSSSPSSGSDSSSEEETNEGGRSLFSTGDKLHCLLSQSVDVELVGGRDADRSRLEKATAAAAVDVGGEEDQTASKDPLASWKDILHERVLENLRRLGCRLLLPVQRYAFGAVGEGFDVCGAASTGSGKTLAFLAPLASKVLAQKDALPRPYFPGSHACLEEITVGTDLRWSLWVGGVSSTEQVAEINRSQIDISIGTAGRVDELCLRGKASLEFLQMLVLDEADAMLDLGFRDSMTELALNRGAPATRQTLLFSATFPAKLASLLPLFLKQPYVRLTVGSTDTAAQAEEAPIAQTVKFVPLEGKFTQLLNDLSAFRAAASGEGEGRQAMVFVGSKRSAREVASRLSDAGVEAESMHGALCQEERQRVFRDFRSGKANVLVATSVAARGLDFPDVGLVVNYDLPPTIEVYIHRIGRTGRAGRTGASISYFTKKDFAIAGALANHLRSCRQEVPSFLVQGGFRGSRV